MVRERVVYHRHCWKTVSSVTGNSIVRSRRPVNISHRVRIVVVIVVRYGVIVVMRDWY